jgi:hypothetical protein
MLFACTPIGRKIERFSHDLHGDMNSIDKLSTVRQLHKMSFGLKSASWKRKLELSSAFSQLEGKKEIRVHVYSVNNTFI